MSIPSSSGKVKRHAKAGDSEQRRRYVAVYHDEIDSMAFKTLSPAAVWLLVQLRRAWAGSDADIRLPFARVSWRLAYGVFDKARNELEAAGFIEIIDPGGRPKRPAVYSLIDGWCSKEVTKKLADSPGYTRKIRLKDGGLMDVWYPMRKRRTSVENAALARAAKAAKKQTSIGARKKGKRTLKMKSKKDQRRKKVDLDEAIESVRGRLRESMTIIEDKG